MKGKHKKNKGFTPLQQSVKRIDITGFTISELLLVFVVVCIIAASLFPVIRYSRDRMDRTVCTNNLREIGLALYIYAAEHGGIFPSSLKELYDEGYLSNERRADCPGSKNKGIPEKPDYIYTAGLSVKSPSESILVKDKAKNHKSGWNNVMEVNGAIRGDGK